MKTTPSWQSWPHLRFQYAPTDRAHVLRAANMTMEWYKAGKPAIGHNHPPRSGKTSLIHVLAVELQAAGAPFVHVVEPWTNLAEQVAGSKKIEDNCRRLGFKGWQGSFIAHPISAIESTRYWCRGRNQVQGAVNPWTLITSTIHLVHCNKGKVVDAVRLAVDEIGARPVFIVDEVQLLASPLEWFSTMTSLQAAGAFVVTMTGTANRSDGASILGFYNDPQDEWEAARETVVIRRGDAYVREADGLLVRDITKEQRWGEERSVRTVATGDTVGWDVAFANKWLHPVSAEGVDFKVVVDGDVVKLSELEAKTAERGRSEWLRSDECCRALARKAVQELESWRSDKRTRHTKMLVVTTSDKDYARGSGEKTANAHAREMRRQIRDAIALSPVLSPQELTIEVCTSVTSDGEPDANAQLKLARFALTEPDRKGNEPIDILIVKTMGIVGLDVPECKVQIDASSLRRGPMKKQLATRNLTQWILEDGTSLVREAVTIYPCDPANHAFYQSLSTTSEDAKEKRWEDSAQEDETIEVEPPPAAPEIVDGSGEAVGYVNEGGHWLQGDHDALISRIRTRYPAASVIRKIDVIEAFRQGAFQLDNEPVSSAAPAAPADEWAGRVVNSGDKMGEATDEESYGTKANRLASQVYDYGTNKENWIKLVRTLKSRAKRACRISPDLPTDKIQDYAVVEQLMAALDDVYNAAVTEVAR